MFHEAPMTRDTQKYQKSWIFGPKLAFLEGIMFTQSWTYWVLNCPQKSGRYWVLKIEYSMSPNSELKLSAQLVNICYSTIEYSISQNSELKLSTQYFKTSTNYWVKNFSWTLNYWYLCYFIEYTISLNSELLLSTQCFITTLSTQ